MNFREALQKRRLVLDGSMGALLQSRGLPAGMAPDVWMMSNPEPILQAHSEYVRAGCDIILTNTFGASRWRLKEYDADKDIQQINAKAVELARKAAQGTSDGRSTADRNFADFPVFIAGDIGPSGETVFPTGHKSFDEVTEIFYEQAKILVALGVDLIVVETMFDSLEFRSALSGVRAASLTIPIVAHATFNLDAITDTGATPENIVAIAEGFHCDAVGVNCSTGPEAMIEVVRRMATISRIPISVQPNAGLPKIKGGQTVFPMSADDLTPFITKFFDLGVQILGGCCGTTPEYIRRVKGQALKTVPHVNQKLPRTVISSLSQYCEFGFQRPFVAIGERMNPSGRKKLSDSLKSGDLSLLLQDAELQMKHNGRILDLNVGVPLTDEALLMKTAVVSVQNKFSAPLMIDSASTHALDSGANCYYGRPLLNSINAEPEKIEETVPIVRKHGAAIVCMTTGIDVPIDPFVRLENAKNIVKILREKCGVQEEDIVFDCLGLVVSAMRDGSKATLKTISLLKEYFPHAATTLGLSNVSFGLPNRSLVNSSFLSMAVQRGLDSAIMSVTDPLAMTVAAASDMWSDKPETIEYFIQHHAAPISLKGDSHQKTGDTTIQAQEKADRLAPPSWLHQKTTLEQSLFNAIVEGQKTEVEKQVLLFMEDHHLKMTSVKDTSEVAQKPLELFMEIMTPAIRHLGNLFAARVKFIPHLISAADAMKAGVALLEPLLIKARENQGQSKGVIVFATVKGDIHDIGKNICILMLKNFGFEVIDLGRNVDAELILKTAKEKNAQIVALSALMTTTMMQMKVVIDAVRAQKLPYKVLIGGAVVTPEFAKEIQADGYSTDVGTVVSEVERVLTILNTAL